MSQNSKEAKVVFCTIPEILRLLLWQNSGSSFHNQKNTKEEKTSLAKRFSRRGRNRGLYSATISKSSWLRTNRESCIRLENSASCGHFAGLARPARQCVCCLSRAGQSGLQRYAAPGMLTAVAAAANRPVVENARIPKEEGARRSAAGVFLACCRPVGDRSFVRLGLRPCRASGPRPISGAAPVHFPVRRHRPPIRRRSCHARTGVPRAEDATSARVG